MSQIRIYFEGDPKLKKPLQGFVHKAVPETRGKLRLISGRGRDQAIDDFLASVKLHRDSLVMLLIDSETEDDGRLFQQLQQKTNWRVPSGTPINDRQVCWMVQCMEAWLVADREALRAYYGGELNEGSLPSNRSVETVPKTDVLESLKRATRGTKKGPYHKGRHGPEILEKLNPASVRGAAPHCDRLFQILSSAAVKEESP